jgi:plasmid stabilization system protein ParE
MVVLIRPAAAADIDDAFVWYERQRPGLGEEFLEAVRAALGDIAAYPVLNPVIYRNTRRVLLRRFPYAVFYRVYDKTVVVVACMHGHRNPRRWQHRT